MSFITDHHESPAVTFAEPGATRSLGQVAFDTLQGIGQAVSDPYVNPKPYGDLFWAAERSTRLTGNVVSESASREEAYDRRIKTIKAATGLDLENPERGGYQIDARRQIAQEVRAGGMTSVDTAGGIPEYQRRIFDQKVAELQKQNPDLQFGDLDTEARQIAHGSSVDLAKAASAPASGPAALAVQFAGGALGSRRDPIFIGSMLAGPETAAARTVFGRVAGAAMRSGLYNAGISAMEQPAVQAWREKIGLEHGIVPAIEDVGFAFGLGLIPGAVVQGIKEGFRAPMGRVLAGHPEPGDIEAVKAALPIPEREAAALKAGEESVAADRATLTIQPPKGVPEPLHDDMMAAALKRADQPDAPSPEAVQAVKEIEARNAPAPAIVRGPAGRDESTFSLLEFLARRGGLAPHPDIDVTFGGKNKFVPGFGNLIRKEGMSLDRAREAAVEAGYLQDAAQQHGGVTESTINHLLEAVDAEARGNKQYRVGSEPEQKLSREQDRVDRERAFDGALEEVGIQPSEVSGKLRERVLQIMEREGVSDPLVAHERAVMEESQRVADSGRAERIPDHIPGWDLPDDAGATPGAGGAVPGDLGQRPARVGQAPRATGAGDRTAQGVVEQRITEAAPKTEAEAHAIADQALDDVGRREGMGSLRDRMGEAEAERAPPPVPDAEAEKPARARGDVLDKVPWVDDAGNPKLMTAKGAAAVGERETTLSMLVRSCK